MPRTTQHFIETGKDIVDAMQGMATHAFAGFEKLVTLNLAATKASAIDAFGHIQSLLDAKDVQQMLDLQLGLLQPLAMKYVSYGSHVYNISTESGTEIIKALTALVENFEKNVPPESAALVSVLKSAVVASQKAIETAQGSARKAVELAETNLGDLTRQAAPGVAPATKS